MKIEPQNLPIHGKYIARCMRYASRLACFLLIAVTLIAITLTQKPVYATSGEQVIIFGQTVTCSSLPWGTCEFLDAENVRNLRRAYALALTQRYCGSQNTNQARALLEGGYAFEPDKCDKILSILERY